MQYSRLFKVTDYKIQQKVIELKKLPEYYAPKHLKPFEYEQLIYEIARNMLNKKMAVAALLFNLIALVFIGIIIYNKINTIPTKSVIIILSLVFIMFVSPILIANYKLKKLNTKFNNNAIHKM